jgi:murein L,D-transpeptidase YcbB/YkuD
MHKTHRLFRSVPVAALVIAALVAGSPARGDHFRVDIQDQLDAMMVSVAPADADNFTVVHQFYGARAYEPLWVQDGGLNVRGRVLVGRLAESGRHGLVPSDYGAAEIVARQNESDPKGLADLEILMTAALLRYGQDLKEGRVAPSRVNAELFLEPEKVDIGWLVGGAAAAPDMGAFLDGLAPQSPQYARTVEALAAYRAIAAAGGWETLAEGETLKVGMRDPRVPGVRRRLRDHGDLTGELSVDPELYDPQLEAAVKRFQYRHGLDQDGAIGKNTRAAFNVPVEERIETLILNLERRRWLPDNLGDRYVFVNMAGFELKLVEGDKTVFDTRVVVGTPFHRTPVFSGLMTYVVVNPFWHITPSIARNEILPSVKKDVNYLASKNIRVFSDWSANAYEINPHSVDWSQVSRRGMKFKFRQDSGPTNALGRVKFMFPNRHNIYLHDTPSKHLFKQSTRSFSHGCIRVQYPLDFATFILRHTSGWTRDKIDQTVASGARKVVNLPQSIPVHLTYLTNWVNQDGSVYFRKDIYGRDKLLSEALVGPKV